MRYTQTEKKAGRDPIFFHRTVCRLLHFPDTVRQAICSVFTGLQKPAQDDCVFQPNVVHSVHPVS